jgi:hypothetical protein
MAASGLPSQPPSPLQVVSVLPLPASDYIVPLPGASEPGSHTTSPTAVRPGQTFTTRVTLSSTRSRFRLRVRHKDMLSECC